MIKYIDLNDCRIEASLEDDMIYLNVQGDTSKIKIESENYEIGCNKILTKSREVTIKTKLFKVVISRYINDSLIASIEVNI